MKHSIRSLAALLATPVGCGWTTTDGLGYRDAYGELWRPGQQGVTATQRWVRFERTEDDLTVVIVLNLTTPGKDSWAKKNAFHGLTVEGHTLRNGRSFTRVGVDCSSCELVSDAARVVGHAYAALTLLLAGEWTRCEAAHNRSKTAVSVPGLPFTVQPEWFAKSAAELEAGRVVRLTPHGFGTGYTLSRRRQQRFDDRASLDLEAKLGITPVYVSKFDHD